MYSQLLSSHTTYCVRRRSRPLHVRTQYGLAVAEVDERAEGAKYRRSDIVIRLLVPTAIGRPAESRLPEAQALSLLINMAAIVRRQLALQFPSLSCAITSLSRNGVRTPAWRSQPNRTSTSPFNGRGFRTSLACEHSFTTVKCGRSC